MTSFWIGTSWKMNNTIAETRSYLTELAAAPLPDAMSVFVVPSFTALPAARETIGDAPVHLGAQNMHWDEKGAHTGEISPLMLLECGVEIVELGHSERRTDQAESDADVNAKVRSAIAHDLRPLVCVGDHEEELAAGASAETVIRQVKLAFSGIDTSQLSRSLIAYEPVWAIGESGRVASPEHVEAVHRAVRDLLDTHGLASVPVLYGGSVNAGNAGALAATKGVGGLFVGRSAWTAGGFLEVIAAAEKGLGARSAAASV
ncbi:triose-phosphate isomerase [Rhodobium gokarnense]|uniref:Triosephosphate isomerase n=1 Tax=Rhodobium gokarnense TaxID=364296 RepID=A0ABT3HDN6_9HYPH|nr:triose-phosphate isomerase [Rhodobium gokarnense]MCW2308434.1 triosephosphate isomerase [Rhodobium gokarnense]